jgi:hypothetical protein
MATLYINDLVTPADYKKILRLNYLLADMLDYLVQTNNWKLNTVDQIWWEVHKTALYSLTQKREDLYKK